MRKLVASFYVRIRKSDPGLKVCVSKPVKWQVSKKFEVMWNAFEFSWIIKQ